VTLSLIPPDTRVRRFSCTGGETAFPVSFPFFAASDLAVLRVRAGVTSTLALGTDYTVSGAGDPAGGTVTLTAAALAGDLVVIVSAQAVARTSEWTDGAALTARALNAEFARWWIALQQAEARYARALAVPVIEPPGANELPPVAERANKVLGFNAAGEPVAVPGASLGGYLVSSFTAGLVDNADAASWRDDLDVLPRDGSRNMTGPLQVAAGAGGGIRVAGDDDTRIEQSAGDTWQIQTGGAARLTVANNEIRITQPLLVQAGLNYGIRTPRKTRLSGAAEWC
jgi:hypothetical protein